MRPCARAGCTGVVDDTGYCDAQGHRNVPQPTKAVEATGEHDFSVVPLPRLPATDPLSHIDPAPHPPEHGRPCARPGCTGIVGGGYLGQPPLFEGVCSVCRTPYSFRPKLLSGEMVDRYRVLGCLAHGGLGWVYLAWDTRLELHVALKGLIGDGDEHARRVAVRERQILTVLHHPNIVRILNFVTHPDPRSGAETDYIVMEYVDGQPLHRLAAAGDLPVEQVIAYGLGILSAFEYLHGFADTGSGRRGLLYCDMKPDNVLHTGDRVKLIDLGAARWIGDRTSPLVHTRDFQVPQEEIDEHWLTVRSDLHTVGRTLEALLPDDWQAEDAPGAESFLRLLRRATAPFEERFASAAEMAEQLRGVLREILSLRDGVPRPEPSTVFAPTAALLDAGLGAVPPLDHWTDVAGRTASLDPGRPSPAQCAVRLPTPRVDPGDPEAGYLANVSVDDPRRLVDTLAAPRRESAQAHLLMCRAHLELAEIDEAGRCLERAGELLGGRAPYDWRMAWHRGLLALAEDRVEAARERFDAVCTALPGEDAPRLALGFCAEHLGEPDRAARHYRAVWRRDRSQVSAAFGLARIHLAEGARGEAVRVLDQVPRVSRHFDAARIAAVRIHAGRLPGGAGVRLPTAADLGEAVNRLPDLYLDGGDRDGDARARLRAVLQEAALGWVLESGTGSFRRSPTRYGAPVLADPVGEAAQRALLEESLRRLAQQAQDAGRHDALIDLANTVRPRTRR
ncbi:serine/threonine-protein kinase [Streptosporangium saharense]|uniref:non-specific serine/threonine protein kinase n=1 Tax=Streptosporangium saharense TaxID=1706840 RepID=A0A7W7QIA9_9ACTN|nr:serine/threonine-protein kinase [Streptosporangium saharense]MBB4914003.1 serine/threonine-protein kinase PknG [Streptosporangium saharense]